MEGRKDREFVCEEVREIEIDREREGGSECNKDGVKDGEKSDLPT